MRSAAGGTTSQLEASAFCRFVPESEVLSGWSLCLHRFHPASLNIAVCRLSLAVPECVNVCAPIQSVFPTRTQCSQHTLQIHSENASMSE